MDLRQHAVLLGGATGRIGSAFARHVLQHGGRLAIAVRRPWQVAKVYESLGRDRVFVGCVPPQDGEAAAGMVKGGHDAVGPLTALVVAAGRHVGAPVGQEPAGELAELLEANLLAAANLARAAVGRLRRRGSGTMTFVGAALDDRWPAAANVRASKGALHDYARGLAVELAGTGVQVGAVLPGPAPRDDAAALARWEAAVVAALAACAFGPRPAGGPLFPVGG